MKIGLLGQFGSGNTGNDGSLEAMLDFLRASKQEATLLCVCSNPAAVTERYKVDAISIGGVKLEGNWSNRLNRLLADFPRRLGSLYAVIRGLRGVSVLIIPGTGILDDFQETAFGWPFVVFRWCLAARLQNARIAFVSIGAGPIENPLSRWFLKSAARMAQYRSYRDDFSLEYMKGIGLDVTPDLRYPDIAFRLPLPASVPAKDTARTTVGVGVMDYHGWKKANADNAEGERIHNNYIAKLTKYICWLIDEGHNARLLTGDLRDGRAVKQLMKSISSTRPDIPMERIAVGHGGSLHELMSEIAQTDIVVVSRYHNVVCALKSGRPTISLSYNLKNDYLLSQFRQAHYCQHIETFDVEKLKQQTNQVLGNMDAVKQEIAGVNRSLQEKLAEQEAVLLHRVIAG
ncbi:polysaccharide pyruvyl transferase family protein [Phyllobacterium sp. BT25]|uniref:Polysaccharide pyruvyl transferase family protein n=1 Tax=Phyllobacterium pellucidum TaxID=2740464 RepID=A0A849VNB5_9HYPH|nr:polysaccharide pyruvyl transferase family protein [Phyllobacterium pellucidum]NTS30906.1 polysaccharide pyruvyl transferase family protein [Phyllobacterium pellucidum]